MAISHMNMELVEQKSGKSSRIFINRFVTLVKKDYKQLLSWYRKIYQYIAIKLL